MMNVKTFAYIDLIKTD